MRDVALVFGRLGWFKLTKAKPNSQPPRIER
jgi:hypothetical protein